MASTRDGERYETIKSKGKQRQAKTSKGPKATDHQRETKQLSFHSFTRKQYPYLNAPSNLSSCPKNDYNETNWVRRQSVLKNRHRITIFSWMHVPIFGFDGTVSDSGCSGVVSFGLSELGDSVKGEILFDQKQASILCSCMPNKLTSYSAVACMICCNPFKYTCHKLTILETWLNKWDGKGKIVLLLLLLPFHCNKTSIHPASTPHFCFSTVLFVVEMNERKDCFLSRMDVRTFFELV